MRTRLTAILVGAVVLLGACGDSDDGSDTAAATTTTQSPASGSPTTDGAASDNDLLYPPSSTSAAPAAGATSVGLQDTPLGRILVDGGGRTLYMFAMDSKGQAGTCEGQCLAAWPALLAPSGAPVAGSGVDGALLSTIARSDGTSQVAYAGWPLYTFARDTAPGDTAGQGVNGVWFVLDAAGTVLNN